jgi:hypothetical protein
MANQLPTILFKPNEGIKWICVYDSITEYIIAIYLSVKYDDIRMYYNISDFLFLKDELLLNEWIQLPCANNYNFPCKLKRILKKKKRLKIYKMSKAHKIYLKRYVKA